MFRLRGKEVFGPESTGSPIRGSPAVKVSVPEVVSPLTETMVETTAVACERRTTGLFNLITRPTPGVSRFSGTLPTAGTNSGSPSSPHVHPGPTASDVAVYIAFWL